MLFSLSGVKSKCGAPVFSSCFHLTTVLLEVKTMVCVHVYITSNISTKNGFDDTV